MQTNETQEILAVLGRVFKKRKWILLLTMLVVLLPVVLYNELTQPVYEASSMLVFEELAQSISSYGYDFTREVYIQNQLEEIKSQSFAQDVIRLLTADMKRRFVYPDDAESVEFDSAEFLVTYTQENITAFPVKNSNVVKLTYQANDPALCVEVANIAAEVLQKRNVELKQEGVGSTRKFIEEQLTLYKSGLDSAETDLRTFKQKNQVTSVDQEAQEIMRRVTEAEVLYNSIKSDRGSVQERLQNLQRRLAQQRKDLLPSMTDIGSPWAQKLRDQLVEKKLHYLNLKNQGYADNHPKMIDIKQKVEGMEKQLKDKALELAKGTNVADPLSQIEKFVNESVELQIELESLRAREAELRNVIAGYNKKLSGLPSKEFNLARLTRDRDVNHKIYMMLLEKREEAKISEAETAKNIRIIDKAQLSTTVEPEPIKPRKVLNIILALILGTILGITAAFVLELNTNNKLTESPDMIESITEWPVLSAIPNINSFAKGKFKKTFKEGQEPDNDRSYRALIANLEPNSVIAESYRMLRTNLQFAGVGKDFKTLLVTSLSPGDGKSTTLANLGVTYANFGNKTLIVDSDLRLPRVHTFFGEERERGIIDLLKGLNELDEMMTASGSEAKQSVNGNGNGKGNGKAQKNNRKDKNEHQQRENIQTLFQQTIRETGIKNLSFVPGGTEQEGWGGGKIVSTLSMPLILKKFENKFNIVLVDSAPLLLVDDTLVLASMVDAVLLVINPDRCNEEMLSKAKKLLTNAKANVIGMVLNKIELSSYYSPYYNSYYAET